MSTILVVDADGSTRDVIGGWLEEPGHDVMVCPGPSAPGYRCMASTGGVCPLAHGADVVVIDMDLDGDLENAGTSSWDLLTYYLAMGKRVVAISSTPILSDPDVCTIHSPARRSEVMAAVRRFTKEKG